jgi:hypothetical protein
MLSYIYLIFDTLLLHIKIQIKFEFDFDPLIFHKVMAFGLKKYHKFSVFRTFQFSTPFSFVLSDIHFIFGTLLCHTKIQIKFEFGFDSLIFLEVMAQWT